MKITLAPVLTTALLLAACGSKTDVNEKNFSIAISQYLDKKGKLCLGLSEWPVEISEGELRMKSTSPTVDYRRMSALETLGLVNSEETAVEITDLFGKPSGHKQKVRRYTLTEKAKAFSISWEAPNISSALSGKKTTTSTDLCWGKKTLDKVVKWEGPMKLGDYQEARISYHYKILELADWAKDPGLQASFPQVTTFIENAGKKEERHGVKLTSIGWEAVGLEK